MRIITFDVMRKAITMNIWEDGKVLLSIYIELHIKKKLIFNEINKVLIFLS